MKDPKDGFDLIEYPCDFAFKAMCKADQDQAASEHINAIVLSTVSADAVLGIATNSSRTGKFESVTVTVKLSSREELEVIYAAIAASERVIMTL